MEYVAARQWYTDIYTASEQITSEIRAKSDAVKKLQEKVVTPKEGETLTEEQNEDNRKFEEANTELANFLRANAPIAFIRLSVKAKGKDISIIEYVILEQLHNNGLISCDLFEKAKK